MTADFCSLCLFFCFLSVLRFPHCSGVEPPLAKVDAQLKHHQDAKERSQDRRAAANIKAARLHANEGYALGTEPEAPHWNKNEEQAQANERNADDASGTAKLH